MSEFGKYLKEKRCEKGITTRTMAKDLKVSVSYISELESGTKLPPNSTRKEYGDLIQRIIDYLKLDNEEAAKMHSLADSELGSKGYLSNDMTDYVNKVPAAMAALRKAKDADISESQWYEFIKQLDKK